MINRVFKNDMNIMKPIKKLKKNRHNIMKPPPPPPQKEKLDRIRCDNKIYF
jgi:hypothetical protein